MNFSMPLCFRIRFLEVYFPLVHRGGFDKLFFVGAHCKGGKSLFVRYEGRSEISLCLVEGVLLGNF